MRKRELIAQYTRINRRFELLYLPKVRKALHVKAQAVIDNLKSGGYNYAISKLSTDLGNDKLAEVIKDIYVNVGLRHARLTHRRIRNDIEKGFGFNQIWTDFILSYLNRFLLEKITFEVAKTTRDALMKVLTVGTVSGLGIDGMIDQLKNWPFERYQAARIIRTEVNRASNVGATAQESTSEYEQQKEWLSVQDFRTRGHKKDDHANHVALNGTKIDSGDEFTDPRNGDRLQFPGDPKASAASTINCRCQAVYVNKRDANGEFIPKRQTTAVIYPGQRNTGPMITIGKELKPDYSEVISHTKEVSEDLKALINEVRFNPEQILKRVGEVEERITDVSIDKSYDVRIDLNETKNVIAKLIEEKKLTDEKSIDDLIGLINSKEYSPEIKLETDSPEVIEQVNLMKAEMIAILIELRNKLIVKKKYSHKISRDENKLITEIISEEI